MKCPCGGRVAGIGGRAPQGARGLKWAGAVLVEEEGGRAPQGARGLKYRGGLGVLGNVKVAPRKGRVG